MIDCFIDIILIVELFELQYGMTALMYAAQGGHFQVAKLLVENGADVNKQDLSNNKNIIDRFMEKNTNCGTMNGKGDDSVDVCCSTWSF
jgi:hypothetical protein